MARTTLALWPVVPAWRCHSFPVTPQSRAGGRHKVGHSDSMGHSGDLRWGGDKATLCRLHLRHPLSFRARSPTHCRRSAPWSPAPRSPDAGRQQHSPAPSPPTPRPPTPRPPMAGTLGQSQWGQRGSVCSAPHPAPLVPVLPRASPLRTPWGYPFARIPLPASPTSLCPHIPAAGAQHLPGMPPTPGTPTPGTPARERPLTPDLPQSGTHSLGHPQPVLVLLGWPWHPSGCPQHLSHQHPEQEDPEGAHRSTTHCCRQCRARENSPQ